MCKLVNSVNKTKINLLCRSDSSEDKQMKKEVYHTAVRLVLIVFGWQHFYSYVSLLVGVNCSKHMCFLFKTLTLRTATEWV